MAKRKRKKGSGRTRAKATAPPRAARPIAAPNARETSAPRIALPPGQLVHVPDASSPRLKLPNASEKLEHFSELEESFFRAGHELSNAPEAHESFADLDAASPPRRSFWQRLFAITD